MSRKDLFALHSPLFASRSLLFAPHSPAFEPSEGEKKLRELPLARRKGEGMSHSPAFAFHSPGFAPREDLFASHSPEIAGLDELFAASEEGGTRLERLFVPCTSELARQNLRGMPRELRGMDRDEEQSWHDPYQKSMKEAETTR